MASTNAAPAFKPVVHFSKVTAKLYTESDIINWLKRMLGTELQALTDLCTGVVLCKLLHKLMPLMLPVRQLYYNTHIRESRLHNFKLIEKALQKLGVQTTKIMNINKLVSGDRAVIFEFAIWVRQFYDANNNLYRQHMLRNRRHSDVRPSTKAAAGANGLETRDKPRSCSMGGVASQQLDTEVPCDGLKETATENLPVCARYKSGFRRAAAGAACHQARRDLQVPTRPQQQQRAQQTGSTICKNQMDADRRSATYTISKEDGCDVAIVACQTKDCHYQAPPRCCSVDKQTVPSTTTGANPSKLSQTGPIHSTSCQQSKAQEKATTAAVHGAEHATQTEAAAATMEQQRQVHKFNFTGNKPVFRFTSVLDVELKAPLTASAGTESGKKVVNEEEAVVNEFAGKSAKNTK